MKTLHLTNAYHPTSGGIKTFYREMLRAANELKRPMRLVVPGERSEVETVGDYGLIYHVAAPRSPALDGDYRVILPHRYLFSNKSELRRIIADEEPDLIEIADKYALNWLGGLIKENLLKLKKRPVVVGFSCERMDDNVSSYLKLNGQGKRLAQIYMRRLYSSFFDYHIANSPYTAQEIFDAVRGNRKFSPPEARIRICPMGANCDDFRNARRTIEARKDLLERAFGTNNFDERTTLLLYAGRLSPEKNLPLLIEMMKRLIDDETRDYRLVIVGRGRLEEWLKAEASRLSKPRAVSFLGHVESKQTLAALYANSDAFVRPNPREPFGIAPLEAMAANLPLVAPNSGGVTSYADDSNAWLAAAPDGESFANAVREIFSDHQAREAKLARARATAEAHSWSSVTRRLFTLYDELYERSLSLGI